MADYTIELRDVINSGIPIFDFPYDFYDEKKRLDFEKKFVKHFYFREIGCETVDRFKMYLEDKMNTVFPYYNELFKSADIEYEILDNYKLTETYTRKVENDNKQSAISSTVGQTFGNQDTETNQNRTVNTVGTFDGTENGKETEKGKSTTEASGISNTTKNETDEGETTKTNNSTANNSETKTNNVNVNGNSDTVKKFLDTPQGQVDLSNSKYLTTLNHDKTDNEQSTEGTETTTGNQTVEGTETSNDTRTTNGLSNTETNDNSETNSENEKTTVNTIEQDTTGKETTVDNVTGSLHSEEKSTTDNNTRMYSNGEQNETYTLSRRGNIGVDTDSDAIEKHNRLQKTLKRIELMFFEECEDLFMLVY